MNRTCWLVALLVVLASGSPALRGEPTPAVDVEMLRRKQEHQQRARDLARELVSSILDIQLQQLSENGLEHLPLSRDISQMRIHLDGLIEAEMAEVVNLLLKAQDQLPAEREATFVEARKKTREVVVRLSIERQNLLRRLKTAELAAQVKRLISMQTIVANATHSLPAQPSTRQEAALVATIQDQRDVQALFARLVEMLREVRGWGGEVGQGAAEGLATLRTTGVAQRLAEAISELELAEFDLADEQEAAILKGLRLLLEKIEETQGLVGTDRELALENVRQLIAQQQQLRDDTRAAELDEATIDKLIERQATVQKEIGRLPEMLNRVPAALPAVEAARRAASEASARIFDAKREAAVAQQTAAAAQLAAVEQQLLAAAQHPNGAQSAAQLEHLAQALAEAQQRIERAQAETAQVQTPAEKTPAETVSRHLARAAEQLAEIKPRVAFPEAVKSAIEEAADQTQHAAQVAQDADAEPGEVDHHLPATRRAQQHAQSEVAAALADARRKMLSARYEEWSKAAEALDRASGAQREVAQQAAQAAAADGLQPERAKDLAAQETAIGQVAKHVNQAVAQAVPEAATTLEQAASAIEATRRQLEPKPAPHDKPDAQRVAQQAQQAVTPLMAAADQLRSAAAQAARELDAESRRQRALLEPVRDAAAQASMSVPLPDDTAERLSRAEQIVRAALAHQDRASGQPEAARASELADRAAQQPATQPVSDSQPRVTAAIDEARQLSRSGAPHVDKELGEALAASQEAERKLQTGEVEAARGQQQKVAAALRHSAEMLRQAIDSRARREATRLAARADQAAQLAMEAAPLDPAALLALQSAEQAGHRPAQPADPAGAIAASRQVNQDLERAAASLAARDQRLRHAQAMAAQLMKAAEGQRRAAAEIEAGRQALAAASSKAASASDPRPALAKPAARLEQAMKRYAAAASAGQRAAEEAGDTSGIADPALVDALAAAAKLHAASPAVAAGPAAAAASAKPAAEEAADSKIGQLSAEETARLLAGSEALGQLQAAQPASAAPAAQAQAGKPGSAAKPSAAGQAAPQASAATSEQSASSASGDPSLRDAGNRADDARPGQRTFREEPWVAKLPPELRQAIRAQSQRRPPAAYEERLRRYFENID